MIVLRSLQEYRTHYGLWTKSGPRSVLWIKFYWNAGTLIHFCVAASTAKTELRSCDRDHVDSKSKLFTTWPCTEKVCRPLFCTPRLGSSSGELSEKGLGRVKECVPHQVGVLWVLLHLIFSTVLVMMQ